MALDGTSYPDPAGPCVPPAGDKPALFNHLRLPEVLHPRHIPDGEALERIADILRATGQYHVAIPFEPPARYAEDDGTPTRRALFVDVETTGLDPAIDAVIQFAAVPFEYAPSDGRIFTVGEALVAYEDPGRPIPPEITTLTGITDADVAGQRIDDARVAELVASACLVVAHNAGFDRRFLDRRFPAFTTRPWACSLSEVPWKAHAGSAKLEFLLFKLCGRVFGAHRADQDCLAGIHLLATPLPTGERPMAVLLRSCRRRTARIRALQAPFSQKGALKARGYRWNGGDDGHPKAWYVDVPEEAAEAERAWLETTVYRAISPGYTSHVFDARDRYSDRV